PAHRMRRLEDRLMSSYSLTQHKVITMEDIDAAVRAGAKSLLLRDGAILTPSAQEGLARHGMVIEKGRAESAGAASDWDRLFRTPRSQSNKNQTLRGRAKTVEPPVRGRNRRHPPLPPHRYRRDPHADPGQQGRPPSRRPLPRRPRRQTTRRQPPPHQRDPPA